jgi:hypothetical protein
MRKFTQQELLEEGFWDGFKKVANVGKVLGKAAAKAIDPDLYGKIKSDVEGIKSISNNVSKAANLKKFIINSLASQGYIVVPDKTTKLPEFSELPRIPGDPIRKFRTVIQTDPNYLRVGDQNPETPVIVDDDGKIIRNLLKQPDKSKKASSNPKPNQANPTPTRVNPTPTRANPTPTPRRNP